MSVFADHLNQILNATNGFLYGSVLLVLLLFTGIYFSIRTRIVQFRMAREGIRLLFQDNDNKESVSGFQALMVSCASRLGVGNITGVASAIILGGPGAIFWMWMTAALGGASAFVESTLAQLYKVKTPEGGFQGGPSYYLVKIFKRRWVGVVFALSLIITFSYGFQMLQANAVTASLQRNFGDSPWVAYGTAVIMTILTAYAVFGGQKIIAKVSEVIVPFMAIGFLLVSLAVIALNVQRLPHVFGQIFSMAFNFESVSGGFSGTAISIGLRRGLYSNEAGMGSAPNAAGTVDDTHPAKQGLVQMLAVHIDTLILCTATALLILCPGVSWEGKDGGYAMPLVQAAVESQFGAFGLWFVSISVFFFAFGTIIGNVYYVETNVYLAPRALQAVPPEHRGGRVHRLPDDCRAGLEFGGLYHGDYGTAELPRTDDSGQHRHQGSKGLRGTEKAGQRKNLLLRTQHRNPRHRLLECQQRIRATGGSCRNGC